MKRLMFLFFALTLTFFFQSCTQDAKDAAPENLRTPILPNISLLTIPTQSFGVASEKETSSTRNNKSNWVHAGLNVLVWNSVVFVNTAVPIAAFGHAFEHEAQYIGDHTWEWKYTYQSLPAHGSKVYDVSLTGQYISNNEEVAWTMTVTSTEFAQAFVWFEGVIAVGHRSGTFTVNMDPNNPKPYMEISLDRNTGNEDVTIRFSNVLVSEAGYGDYIEWRAQNDADFDRAYDVFTDNNLLEIEANEVGKDGRVKDPKHFGDAEWHCWDSQQVNIEC